MKNFFDICAILSGRHFLVGTVHAPTVKSALLHVLKNKSVLALRDQSAYYD